MFQDSLVLQMAASLALLICVALAVMISLDWDYFKKETEGGAKVFVVVLGLIVLGLLRGAF